ncbi:hypothetical protein BV25DRAFT_1846939 [Artomyces pyxidatus]|uniref:Uncharacterized protein n=1 Tax=Artomyces pyxidatus TaxID=48021 RepID=A0ACB8TH20_9AGAM|nr:hypothetical protein BV25DRAFT_1846939 [Artomyces pyxidatus]
MLFLALPPEIRLHVYDVYFTDHKRVRTQVQPNNDHIRLLHVSRTIFYEAASLFRTYLSLSNERQINVLLRDPAVYDLSAVLWADVANDGRVLRSSKQRGPTTDTPISRLHLVLQRMDALQCIRVFDCRQGLPVQGLVGYGKSLQISSEGAMFPRAPPVKLTSYKLHLDPTTRCSLFDKIFPDRLQTLRISGSCQLPVGVMLPSLRHLTLHGVTGNNLDSRPLHEIFVGCELDSFVYSMGDRLGFEIRNHHLESLVSQIGKQLRKLVLLGCSRLSTDFLSASLSELSKLEYLALDLITVNELRGNIVNGLHSTVSVFKINVKNAWFATPLHDEESRLCDNIETFLLRREPPPDHICIRLRSEHKDAGGRADRWRTLAAARGIRLDLWTWDGSDEDI